MNYQKQEQVVLERSSRLKIDQVHMAKPPFEHGYFAGIQWLAGAQTCPNIKRPKIYLIMEPSAVASDSFDVLHLGCISQGRACFPCSHFVRSSDCLFARSIFCDNAR